MSYLCIEYSRNEWEELHPTTRPEALYVGPLEDRRVLPPVRWVCDQIDQLNQRLGLKAPELCKNKQELRIRFTVSVVSDKDVTGKIVPFDDLTWHIEQSWRAQLSSTKAGPT